MFARLLSIDILARIISNELSAKLRLTIIFMFQLATVAFSYAVAYYIRFEFSIPQMYAWIFVSTMPLLIVSRMAAYYIFKLHLGSWRFASLQDLVASFEAVLLGSVFFILMVVFTRGLEEFPRSVFILDMLLNSMLIGGSRFTIRYYHEIKDRGRSKVMRHILVAGAGKGGVLLLNEVRNNPDLGIRIVGFVDDNPCKKGVQVQGVSVLGGSDDIPDLVEEYRVDEVIIAIPSAKYKNVSRIVEIVNNTEAEVKILPGMGKIIKDGGSNGYLNDVACDDLLGRKTIKFCRESDKKLIMNEIHDKVVLVTGAGGSIGSELCRQIIQLAPKKLLLYERYENNLYDLEIELRKNYPDNEVTPIVGDILDTEKLDSIIKESRVNIIYHAAAFKHVPLMEREPLEAVRNNILGTMNVAKLAVSNNLGKFILISTDKAVNPSNIMGTTKRVAELIIKGLNGNGTKLIAVRFGNVIGSNGSVIPLFKKQIAEGGPVTITHPDITRYFMSIPEAVQLVMTAGAMGEGGEIFLLDMGKPIKIADIARELIIRTGLEPEEDIDIHYTGLRPGEKLHEELFWKGEGIVSTGNKKITVLKTNGNDNNVFSKINVLEETLRSGNTEEIIRSLKEMVPESTIKPQSYCNRKEVPCKSLHQTK